MNIPVKEYVAHTIIGTPIENLAKGVRDLVKIPKRMQHPELHEIHVESKRADLAMSRLVTPSMNCIDIGAHLGSVLSHIHSLSPNGTHTAIEPIPYKSQWLQQKFPTTKVLTTALSDTAGTAKFYIQPRRSGFSGLGFHASGKSENQDVEIIDVTLEKLDNLVPSDLTIGFIKMDVEGAELMVLKGSERILKNDRPSILLECTRSGLKTHNIEAKEFYGFLDSHGYGLFLIKDWLAGEEALSYERFSKAMEYPFQAFNFLAIPSEG